jgi:hypothetical protein
VNDSALIRVPAGDSTVRRRRARPDLEAIPAARKVELDGELTDEVWQRPPAAADFVQSEPRDGEPATERTEVWVAFDETHLYVAAYLHDREAGRLLVNDIREDFREENQDDFELLLDTFGDQRNGYVFITNVAGAKSDRQVANEGREINLSWDAVWSVKTRTRPDGWTAEMAIPFRTLRYAAAGPQRWGINFSRRIRRKNEIDFWAPVPRAYNLARVSLAGELLGLVIPGAARDLRIKPYVAGTTVRETGGASFAEQLDGGFDLKLGVTRGLTLDATVNPDFAQVEADEQQVNLTQFSQFFPEKREFFLENSGVFYVGDAARNNRVFQPPTPDEDLLLFHSRRIGLTPDGRAITIPAGVRLTGRSGGFTVGALSIQTRSTRTSPANNYSVVRLRRDVGNGGDVGAIVMSRQATDSSGDYNRVFGADANIRFFGRLDWNSYLIGTATPGVASGQYAWRTSLNYEGNFFHGKVGVLQVGEGFSDDLGYYRRTGARKYLADIGIRPRPAALRRRGVREMHPHVVWDIYEDLGGQLIGRNLHNGYSFFLNDGGFFELSVNNKFQRLEGPLRLSPDADSLPPGRYGWTEYQLRGSTDASRAVSLSLTGILGGLWSGSQRTVNATVTVKTGYRLRLAAGVSRTSADLERGGRSRFAATLVTVRGNYSFSSDMFLDAFAQYDPERKLVNANVRFNLIHGPLSDLYVVVNEQRFGGVDAPTPGRSVIVKFTQMLAL